MSEIWAQAAKSKRPAGEDAPVRQPMRPAAGIRQAPSTDQKKVRRAMSRGVNKSANLQEESVMSDTQREAALLRAMAKATPEEQMRLAAELEDLRGARLAAVREARSVDLGSTVVAAHLTPVATYERNTSGTDWIETVAMVDGDQTLPMKTAATRWFAKVSDEVKADREEFTIQAQGAARREAGAFGEQMAVAQRAFLDQVAHLYRTEAKTASVKQADYNGYTNWDTWNADLWLSNDQALYNACSRAIDADEIRQIYQGAVDSGVITDDIDADAVNWDEVYETFHEDDHLASRKHANDEVDPDNGHANSALPEVTVQSAPEKAFDEGWASDDDEDSGVHPSIPGASTAAKTADYYTPPQGKSEKHGPYELRIWQAGNGQYGYDVIMGGAASTRGPAWGTEDEARAAGLAQLSWYDDSGVTPSRQIGAARKQADADAKYRWDDGDGHTDMQPASAFDAPRSNGWSAERDEDNDEWIVKTPSGVTRRYQRYPYTTSASRKQANDAVDPDNGHADSALPEVTVHTNTDPAFPWEIDETTGKGSADVADTHTPGQGVADYPQPKDASRKQAAQFSTFEELSAHVHDLMAQNPDLVAAAEAAYDRQDQSWFDAQSIETLKILWEIAASAMFVSWDDEVYDALSKHGFDFETAFTSARKTPDLTNPVTAAFRARVQASLRQNH